MRLHLLLIFLLFHSRIEICTALPNSGLDSPPNAEIEALLSGGASGAEDFEMESEMSRRMLIMQKKYISYETLKRDAVPCLTPGASYYNCGAAQANRYSRGCDVITRCIRHNLDVDGFVVGTCDFQQLMKSP